MGFSGISHWLIILVIILLLFGVGRISGVMGELGKGLKSFKKGLADEDEERQGDNRQLPPQNRAPERPIEVTPEPRSDSTVTPPVRDNEPRS